MKILYKQTDEDLENPMKKLGVQTCFLKKLALDRDAGMITKKEHHHNGFEIHFVEEGYQSYEIQGENCTLRSGDCLIIYPGVTHRFTDSEAGTRKYSLTFTFERPVKATFYSGKTPQRIRDNFRFISEESARKKGYSKQLTENSVLEIMVAIFRMLGILDEQESSQVDEEHLMISLARQYIRDNIENGPKVRDVADYCYLSTKHFTRVFLANQGVAPGEYIRKLRVQTIEKLLQEQELSLKQISEKMNFANEYYFNAFFKKYAGMPPGEYRKMVGAQVTYIAEKIG